MTLDAQKAFSGTVAPEGADVLDEAKLTAWMEPMLRASPAR